MLLVQKRETYRYFAILLNVNNTIFRLILQVRSHIYWKITNGFVITQCVFEKFLNKNTDLKIKRIYSRRPISWNPSLVIRRYKRSRKLQFGGIVFNCSLDRAQYRLNSDLLTRVLEIENILLEPDWSSKAADGGIGRQWLDFWHYIYIYIYNFSDLSDPLYGSYFVFLLTRTT